MVNKRCLIITGVGIIFVIIFGIGFSRFIKYGSDNYYDTNETMGWKKDPKENKSDYKTVIDHTVTYKDVIVNDRNDGVKLIEDDSLLQEDKCNNKLGELEEKLKDNTNIYGINFCEINESDAKGISNTITEVFNKYPILKEYITNVTIVNDGGVDSYISAFKPSYTFATSDSEDKFPFVIKIQVFLNASYYLNNQYLENVIIKGIETNYFPKDTTKESLVAHELGHALTYILAIKQNNSVNTVGLQKDGFKLYSKTSNDYVSNNFAKRIVENAYKNYMVKYGDIGIDKFRSNISSYADSKDAAGNVIYNETVAEAFHDYYLHGESAKKESLEIMNIINSYL